MMNYSLGAGRGPRNCICQNVTFWYELKMRKKQCLTWQLGVEEVCCQPSPSQRPYLVRKREREGQGGKEKPNSFLSWMRQIPACQTLFHTHTDGLLFLIGGLKGSSLYSTWSWLYVWIKGSVRAPAHSDTSIKSYISIWQINRPVKMKPSSPTSISTKNIQGNLLRIISSLFIMHNMHLIFVNKYSTASRKLRLQTRLKLWSRQTR